MLCTMPKKKQPCSHTGDSTPAKPKYMIARFDDIPPVRCPCGFARRAFAAPDNPLATMHIVNIQADSRAHYHRRMTEIYFVLEGTGQMELDGQLFPVKPNTAIFIKPGCRHRAIGKLKILNVPIPAFDESDEWFD
jgi:mannose-6-phosphate isomerase-like protein (cupin superfamily)